MNAPARISPAALKAQALMAERADYPAASAERDWRKRAAWKLTQMDRGIPAIRWTDTPPEDFA